MLRNFWTVRPIFLKIAAKVAQDFKEKSHESSRRAKKFPQNYRAKCRGGGGFPPPPPPPDLLGLIQPMSTEHSPDLLELQSDLGYPATSGPAPIHISNLPGYVRYAKNTASSVRCIHVHVIMYLLIDTVFVLFLSIFLYKMDI